MHNLSLSDYQTPATVASTVEHVTPGCVIEKDGVDYAGPFHVKYGMVHKPTNGKAYVCVFVSLVVKADYLELVTDLTTDAFIATL